MLPKIKAAVDARHDQDFIIMAMTDALAVHGFRAAIERANKYYEAGADLIFIEAPTSNFVRSIIPQAPLPSFPMSESDQSFPGFSKNGQSACIGCGPAHRDVVQSGEEYLSRPDD